MGSAFFNFLSFVSYVSLINVVFVKREYVYSQDNGVCGVGFHDCANSIILEVKDNHKYQTIYCDGV